MKNITTNIIKSGLLTLLVLSFSLSASAADVLKAEIESTLKSGDTAKAITMLQAEIKVDPAYHFNYYTLGRIYFNWLQYDKALAQFKIALDKKSKHYESLYYYGVCNIRLENLKEAQKAMEDGLKKAPKELKGWFENGTGLVYMAQKNYSEADRAFRRALALHPDNAEYHINLGDANFYQGISALAIIEYEAAMKADTASLEVYYHWAEACLELKDYKCAIEKLKIVLDKDSTHAPAWMRAGSIYYKAARSASTRDDQVNRFKDAIGSYKRYLEISGDQPDSADVRAYYDLAMSYFFLNAFEEAKANFEKVLAIPYEPRDVYFYYGKALWGVKEYAKAGEMLEKHLAWMKNQDSEYRSSTTEEEVFKLIGDSYFFRKPREMSKALEWYNKSLAINPNQKRVLETLAIAYHSNKSYAQALEFYRRRIDLGVDSSDVKIVKNAGFCALNLANAGGDEELGLDEMDEEFMGEDGMPVAGDVAVPADVDYFQIALEYLNKAYEIDPNDSKVVTLLANTYLYQLSDCQNGVKWFERVLTLEPGNCDAKKALGFAYFGGLCTKSYSKALGYLKDAYSCLAKSGGACSDSEIAMWIAQCYHLQAADKIAAKQNASEEFKNAHEWYGKVLECQPTNAIAKKAQSEIEFEF